MHLPLIQLESHGEAGVVWSFAVHAVRGLVHSSHFLHHWEHQLQEKQRLQEVILHVATLVSAEAAVLCSKFYLGSGCIVRVSAGAFQAES